MTPEQAQAEHERLQQLDPEHDEFGSCWCCCLYGCKELVTLAERELIVSENDELRTSLDRGIAQVRAGEITDLDLSSLDTP